MRIWVLRIALVASVAALVVSSGCAGCSGSGKGRIVVALTIDWEGAYLSPEGLDALDEFRHSQGQAPLTHFVSAAYFTKERQDPKAVATITQAVRQGDELAVHLHAWRSLARAAGIEPRLSPSFLTGTDKLLEFEDGDVGFDTDLDAYSVSDLRVLLRTSRRLLGVMHAPVSSTFRAGGYLGTPKVLQAAREEGFTVDCSAADYRQLDERKDDMLPRRVQAIWPRVEATSQPWLVEVAGGSLLEMPIAGFADYATTAEIIAVFDIASARLQSTPGRDVFVVLGFHQETADEFSGRLREALDTVRGRKDIADHLVFTTVEDAAARARRVISPPP